MNGGKEVQETIIIFAIEKLLCRPWRGGQHLATSTEEQFAVMSRRLALDFDTAVSSGSIRRNAENNQMVQVEKHMRVCLGFQEGLESIVTVAPSEPILTEAAAAVMQGKGFSSCRALQNVLEWPGMSKGKRGELIVCIIAIDTLDRLMVQSGQLRSFIVKATSFFKALFAPGIYEDKIQDALPSLLRHDDQNETFAETFKDSRIYVTHFIKVFDFKVLSIEYIMRLAARGVAIVCADNQAGADIIFPMTYKSTMLEKENMTVIICQSKNDRKYSTRPKRYLFSAMNPFTLGIFDKGTDPPPIIRMVYALAARRPVVHVMQRGGRHYLAREAKAASSRKHAYTSFDIWCGHTSSETFGIIQQADNPVYKNLLQLSRSIPNMFNSDQQSLNEVTMTMYPGATSHPSHWGSFCELKTQETVPSASSRAESDTSVSDSDEEQVSDSGGEASGVYQPGLSSLAQ
jgi:hypothetical protein